MPRARVAIAAVVATTCVLTAAACSLSGIYSSEYGEDASTDDANVLPGSDATALPPADATAADVGTPDPVPIVDSGPVDSTLDAGPWGDYCYGVPMIVAPIADATVGLSFEVEVQAPPCIRTMLVYMNGNMDAISPVIGPLDGAVYSLEVTVPPKDAGMYYVNANGWDNTNDAHRSDRLYFNVSASP